MESDSHRHSTVAKMSRMHDDGEDRSVPAWRALSEATSIVDNNRDATHSTGASSLL